MVNSYPYDLVGAGNREYIHQSNPYISGGQAKESHLPISFFIIIIKRYLGFACHECWGTIDASVISHNRAIGKAGGGGVYIGLSGNTTLFKYKYSVRVVLYQGI